MRWLRILGIPCFLGFHPTHDTPGHYTLDCVLYTERPTRVTAHASKRRGCPRLVVSVMRLIIADLDNIRMYLDDAIGFDDTPIHHVATLAAFFEHLRIYKLKPSLAKSRLGAAQVGFLGHAISSDGVQ